MDRREKLMDAIGEVGSDLIFRAEKERFAPSALRRWGGLAAALVIVAGLTLAALPWLGSANQQPAQQTQPQPDVSTTTEVTEEQTDTADATDTVEDTMDSTDEVPPAQTEDTDHGLEELPSWSLDLPSYDDARALWLSGRSNQLLSSFVSTLELGCTEAHASVLDFPDSMLLSSEDLSWLFILLLNQQKNNGWYLGPSYEERWFEPQEDLPEDSPYRLQGGWYDIPVSEFQSMLQCWLPAVNLEPDSLSNYIPEEDVLRFSTISGLGGDVFLELADVYFYDENKIMSLAVNRYADEEKTQLELVRYYTVQFDSGLAKYTSILTE